MKYSYIVKSILVLFLGCALSCQSSDPAVSLFQGVEIEDQKGPADLCRYKVGFNENLESILMMMGYKGTKKKIDLEYINRFNSNKILSFESSLELPHVLIPKEYISRDLSGKWGQVICENIAFKSSAESQALIPPSDERI